MSDRTGVAEQSPPAPTSENTHPRKDLTTRLKEGRDRRAELRKDRRKRRRDAAEDRVKARRDRANHRLALRDVGETTRAAEHACAQRAADRTERTVLGDVFRRARVSGARARLTSQISQSAEARRLRVQAVRAWTLRIGIPVLLGFGLWSTSGVHAGVVTALHLTPGRLTWWAAWVVEPGLIVVVAAVLIGRAILRTAGGDVDWRALVVMVGALAVSLALSVLPVWPDVWGPSAVAAVVAKSLGPVGAAVTAHLIGMFDDYATNARPEEGAVALDEMRLERPVPAGTAPTLADTGIDVQGPVMRPAAAVDTEDDTPPVPTPWTDPAEEWEPTPTNNEDEHTDPWAACLDDEDQDTEPWGEDPFATVPAPAPGERTSVVTPEPAPLLDTWKAPVLPVDDRGRQIPPKVGETAFQAAVDLYLDCDRRGNPLSGRKLCDLNGVNPDNRLWRQAVIREAKAQQAAAAGRGTHALF